MEELAEKMHQALMPVLHYQPAAPLVELSSHFRERAHDSDPISASCRRLRWCGLQQPASGQIIQAAHQQLAGRDGCLSATSFLTLMEALTDPLGEGLAGQLMELFESLSRLPASFATFSHAVRSCLLVEQLAGSLPEGGPGRGELEGELRSSLEVLLQQAAWLHQLSYPDPVTEWGQRLTPLDAGAAQQAAAAQVAKRIQAVRCLLPA